MLSRATCSASRSNALFGLNLSLTMAMIVRNPWVDASGDVGAAVKADRRGLALLIVAYAIAVTLLMVLTLT